MVETHLRSAFGKSEQHLHHHSTEKLNKFEGDNKTVEVKAIL